MSLRILGGNLKGLTLTVNDKVTKPTGVMLKRKIFDARQRLDGYRFIDLCAGSGSIGYEALSRGASPVFLVENNFIANKNILNALNEIRKRHIEMVNFDEISISRQSADQWLQENVKNLKIPKTIIFFDPPYDNYDLYRSVFDILKNSSYKGEFWVEYDTKGDARIIEIIDELFITIGAKRYQHGQHQICIFNFE